VNLADMVQRGEWAVSSVGPPPEATVVKTALGAHRAILMPPQCRLTVRDVLALECMGVLHSDLGWYCAGPAAGTLLTVQLAFRSGQTLNVGVAVATDDAGEGPRPIRLDWPTGLVLGEACDLVIGNAGEQALTLLTAPLVNTRKHLLQLVRGRGIEVGPGLRPQVLPTADVDVRYVERESPERWLALYGKDERMPPLPPPEILARYTEASAVTLAELSSGDLDFVFSSHVFEHLPNPLRVMRNWLAAVRPGGLVMGVVPDPRYTFDCRQAVTTRAEAQAEAQSDSFDIPLAKYERWCKYTEPRHTPQELISRQYSIHVNFFSPDTFLDTMNLFKEEGVVDRVFIHAERNHKDFAFVLRKAG